MNTIQRLLLVDGSSYLYRAFHAMPELKNSQGFYTGALYGLTSMLRKLKQAFPSTYCACVFDAKGKTFRHDMYPLYKANRSAMPENLVAQLDYVDELVNALGWLIIKIPRIEADDVIGTLANYAKDHMPVLIATGDKDMAQLVQTNVHLIDTMKNTYMDIEGVKGKFELLPQQIIDYLTLMGDTSDNIPGIAKVGPKTAVKWLKEYETLDNIIQNADKIKGVVGENLRKSLDWIPMGRKLVTININCIQELDHNLPNWQSWRAFGQKHENQEILENLFNKFEFKGFLKDIQNTTANAIVEIEPEITIDVKNYSTITSLEQLSKWIELIKTSQIVSLDTETTSLNPLKAELVGISMAIRLNDKENSAVYIPIHPNQQGLGQAALDMLKAWLEDKNYKKVGQNIKYDLHIFRQAGIEVLGFDEDTMLASYVLASHNSHNLDDLARRYLKYQTTSYESICGKGAKQITFDQVDLATATHYAAEDADITLHLHNVLQAKLKLDEKLYKVYKDIECPISHVLLDMETSGILLDVKELNQQSQNLHEQLMQIEQKAFILAGKEFNLSSPKQLAEILFNELNLPVVKKTSGGIPSTDEEVLTKLSYEYPLPKLLLEHRTLAKLKTTYTDKLPLMINPKTNRIHTSFAQAIAITGRLSSNEPNLQNIPIKTPLGRKIRQAFIAKENCCLLSADYSQIELRIMAHLSKDSGLLKAFNNNEDVHIATAREIFDINEINSEQRRYAKIINFGLIYGMSAFGVANSLGIQTKAAQKYIDTYFTRYAGVANYMQNIKLTAHEQDYVETILGRRLYLADINNPNYLKRQAAERAAVNAPMQGSAADIIKLAMINIHNFLNTNNLHTKMLLQVHDELILEVPYNELETIQNNLPNLMQSVVELEVPLIVNIGMGDSWEQAH